MHQPRPTINSMTDPDQIAVSAIRYARSHTTGVIIKGELVEPVAYVLTSPGTPVASVPAHILDGASLTLAIVIDDAAQSLQLLIEPRLIDPDSAAADRWKIYHGSPRHATFTELTITSAKFFGQLVEVDRLDDPLVRQDIARFHTKVQIMRYTGMQALTRFLAGKEPGPESSIGKLFWSHYHQEVTEAAMNLMGVAATVGFGQETRSGLGPPAIGTENTAANWISSLSWLDPAPSMPAPPRCSATSWGSGYWGYPRSRELTPALGRRVRSGTSLEYKILEKQD